MFYNVPDNSPTWRKWHHGKHITSSPMLPTSPDETWTGWDRGLVGALSCRLPAAPRPQVSSQSLRTLQPSKGLSSCFFNIIVLVCDRYHQKSYGYYHMDMDMDISTESHCLETFLKLTLKSILVHHVTSGKIWKCDSIIFIKKKIG